MRYQYILVVFSLVFPIAFSTYVAKLSGIKPVSNCKAELDNGQLIDLSSLDNPSNPMNTQKDDYTYYYSPCSPIKCGQLIPYTSAICQTNGGDQNFNLGTSKSPNFLSWDDQTKTLQIVYSDGTQGRKSNVNCQCSQSESFTYNGERPSLVYTFTLQSKCCCPDGCKGKKPGGGSSGGLSGGSIILIIFFSLIFVYLIGGIILMKFVCKKDGMEMIPNITIWVSVGDHIKEGFRFTRSKITGRSNYSRI